MSFLVSEGLKKPFESEVVLTFLQVPIPLWDLSMEKSIHFMRNKIIFLML